MIRVSNSILLFILLFIATFSFGQINQTGLPFIRTFMPEDYDGSDQNWAAVQDNRGIMYFGNNDRGVLEYDGKTWRKIPVPYNASVRSLAVDSLGTVYVGTIGEFGYLAPDNSGKLEYKSLFSLIEEPLSHVNDIFKIYVHKGIVYFYSQNYLFRYDGKKVDYFDINPNKDYYNLFSFLVNNRIYIGSYILGLREFADSSATIAPNGEYFKGFNIFSITPYDHEWVDVITHRGIYRYNQNSGEAVELSSWKKLYGKTSEIDAIPYHGISLENKSLGIAFLFSKRFSFTQTDSLTRPRTVLNTSNGLPDETVTFLCQPNKGISPLWLCLNIGIARADIHSQVRVFSEESGLKGGILSLTQFNNTLFVGTMSGVFYKTTNEFGFTHFKQIQTISSATWSFLVFKEPKSKKERLLVGTTTGIFEIDENFKATNITIQDEFVKGNVQHVGYTLLQSKYDPSIVYIGWSALAAMKWEGGRWKNLGKIKSDELRNEYRSSGFSLPNEVWLSANLQGVSRVTFGKNDTIVENYGVEHGLPGLKDNHILTFDDKVFISTEKGIFQFDATSKRFNPTSLPGLNGNIEGYGISRVVKYEDGYALTCSSPDGHRWVEIIKPNPDGSLTPILKPFKALPARWTDAIFTDSNGILWLAISTQLFSYDSKIKREYDQPFNALIRKVTTKGDSVLFRGAFYKENPDDGKVIVTLSQQLKQTPTLPFRFNSLVFDVAATFYESEEATVFSYILEGNDKEWTRWENDPRPSYMNLSEGSYVFKVKAKNIYGEESSVATYSFSITPPWYRSIIAYISYVILLALFIWAIVVLNTRRLIAEKEHLEQIVKERTAEVVAQKEEIEGQRDLIFEQNEEIKSSINYASRIQGALLTPLETINAIFDDYFILFLPRDIVSGDFYWHTQVGNRKICVVADCTGHGVPGGFMSMLGIGFLTQIVAKDGNLPASQILDQLRLMIITSLHQTGKPGESKDGMDLALYIVDTDAGVIEYAGANNPLILIRNDEVIHYKGDKMPIGIHMRCDTPFTNNIIEYQKGDVLYTFSDGYPDQFGGPDERKFMIKNLKEKLLEIHKLPMTEQREILHQTLIDWQGSTPRIDDVVLMGLRL